MSKKGKVYRARNTVMTNGEVVVLNRDDFSNQDVWRGLCKEFGFSIRTESILMEVVYARKYDEDEV